MKILNTSKLWDDGTDWILFLLMSSIWSFYWSCNALYGNSLNKLLLKSRYIRRTSSISYMPLRAPIIIRSSSLILFWRSESTFKKVDIFYGSKNSSRQFSNLRILSSLKKNMYPSIFSVLLLRSQFSIFSSLTVISPNIFSISLSLF